MEVNVPPCSINFYSVPAPAPTIPLRGVILQPTEPMSQPQESNIAWQVLHGDQRFVSRESPQFGGCAACPFGSPLCFNPVPLREHLSEMRWISCRVWILYLFLQVLSQERTFLFITILNSVYLGMHRNKSYLSDSQGYICKFIFRFLKSYYKQWNLAITLLLSFYLWDP